MIVVQVQQLLMLLILLMCIQGSFLCPLACFSSLLKTFPAFYPEGFFSSALLMWCSPSASPFVRVFGFLDKVDDNLLLFNSFL